MNLLANALDAVDRNGRVDVAPHVEDGDVLITVSDTGHGISPEDLRRIFEPFYTTKGRGKGTGLGLAICRQLTAALGGTISVQSQPGRGVDVLRAAPARRGGARLVADVDGLDLDDAASPAPRGGAGHDEGPRRRG